MPEPVDISKWGPAAWDFMYAVAFSYPNNPTPQEQQAAVSFFGSLGDLLPCERCRKHFSQYLQEYPIVSHVSSQAVLSSWLLNLNNKVNDRIGKPSLSLHDVWDRLVNNTKQERTRCMAAGLCVLIAVVGLAAAFWLCYRRWKVVHA